MAIPFFIFATILVLLLFAAAFLSASPASIAGTLRLVGPVILGLSGIVLLIAGRAGIGGILVSGALAWYGSGRMRRQTARTAGQRSTVRTAALEMELDHDTGDLDGIVLAGGFEGDRLSRMKLDSLLRLYGELGGDPESVQLLETYLDGRFPVWRENVEADEGRRKRRAPGSGGMTKEEAYNILGLETGAAAADVRKAHRRLMQRLHPDVGGTSFLAARINEARDVLLSEHQ